MCEVDWTATAAWVQAVFSVLAIVAAIWISKRSSDESRRLVVDERKRQADIVASRIAMQLGLFAEQLEARASRTPLLEEKAKNGAILQRDLLTALFQPTTPDWLTELRQHLLVFDRESGIRIQTVFDVIDGARQKIESSILTHGVLESSAADSLSTLHDIRDVLKAAASTCREVETYLERAHQLV